MTAGYICVYGRSPKLPLFDFIKSTVNATEQECWCIQITLVNSSHSIIRSSPHRHRNDLGFINNPRRAEHKCDDNPYENYRGRKHKKSEK